MGQRSEAQAIGDVLEQLCRQFPTVSTTDVEVIVRQEHASLTGPIRDFVPLLVHKAARRRLAELAAPGPAPVLRASA